MAATRSLKKSILSRCEDLQSAYTQGALKVIVGRGQSQGRALKSQGREFKEGETLALGNKALGAAESTQWVKCWLGDDENLSEPLAPPTLHPCKS